MALRHPDPTIYRNPRSPRDRAESIDVSSRSAPLYLRIAQDSIRQYAATPRTIARLTTGTTKGARFEAFGRCGSPPPPKKGGPVKTFATTPAQPAIPKLDTASEPRSPSSPNDCGVHLIAGSLTSFFVGVRRPARSGAFGSRCGRGRMVPGSCCGGRVKFNRPSRLPIVGPLGPGATRNTVPSPNTRPGDHRKPISPSCEPGHATRGYI